MNKVRTYLRELTIVTIGVLIALVISNLKENNQARKYQAASIETVKNEIEANYFSLKNIIESQISLRDTIKKYSRDHVAMGELFAKGGFLQKALLSNAGLEIYSRNQINSIDFEMMTMLLRMNSLSGSIDANMEKIRDFLYPNLYVDSEISKMLVIRYLEILIQSETQLMLTYEKFVEDYIKTTHNGQ